MGRTQGHRGSRRSRSESALPFPFPTVTTKWGNFFNLPLILRLYQYIGSSYLIIYESCRGNIGILQPWRWRGSYWCQTLGQTAQCRRFGRGLLCSVDLTPFCAGHFWPLDQRRPTKGARASAARRGYVATAPATTSIAESYALGGPMKDRLWRWLTPVGDRSHAKGHD